MTSARVVLEITRSILEGRSGTVAMFKMYMDESGVHDDSPVVTVGAYFGKPSTWGRFTKEWNRKKRPVHVYHSVDCANLRGEFKGWEPTKRDHLVAGLLPVIPAHTLPGICVGVHLKELEKGMADRPELREMFGTPYTACFQWALQFLLMAMERTDANDRLAIVHEQNDYQHEVLSAVDWVRKNRKRHTAKLSITFGTKDEYVPLQAADVLAYEFNKRIRDESRPERKSWAALKTADFVKTLRYGPDNMHLLINGLSRLRDDLLAGGWDGKIVV